MCEVNSFGFSLQTRRKRRILTKCKTRQDHTPDGSSAHAALKEKNQCDGCANHLSLAESEAEYGTPSRLDRCAIRVGMHCLNNLSWKRRQVKGGQVTNW